MFLKLRTWGRIDMAWSRLSVPQLNLNHFRVWLLQLDQVSAPHVLEVRKHIQKFGLVRIVLVC